jgi:hypothetical protein
VARAVRKYIFMQERHVYDLLQKAVDDGQREIRLGEVLNFPWDRACFLPDLIYHHDEELLTGRKRSDFPDWHSGPSDKFYALIIIENDGPAFRVRLQDREFLYIDTQGRTYPKEAVGPGECVS